MKRRTILIAILCLLSGRLAALAAPAPLLYDVSIPDPGRHAFHIAVTVPHGAADRFKVAIPVWTPGYYQILNFSKQVSGFRASDTAGHDLAVEHPDDSTWQVTQGTGDTHIGYDVKAEDRGFGFFYSHLDDKTGYINGASTLIYLIDGKDRPSRISVRLPEGWKVACPLDPAGPNSYRASSYDELIDSPIQMGAFDRIDFDVRHVPFAALLVGNNDVDHAALRDTLSRVAAAGFDLFHEKPFKRYLFIFHFAVGSFGGGLEHHNSTVLNVSNNWGRGAHPFAELAAHEYFHAWNVKRLHPAVLGPFDYTQKVRTGALWFAEGVTDYYAAVLPRMAGLTTSGDFLDTMAGRIGSLERTEARLKVSPEEASQKAWEGFSMGYGGLNYYTVGSDLGLAFDILIRDATDNRRSLDDVMRLVDEQYGQRGKGYDEDALMRAINQVAGKDLSGFYNQYVRAPGDIPWSDVLAKAGLRLEPRADKNPDRLVPVETADAKALRVRAGLLREDQSTPAAAASLPAAVRLPLPALDRAIITPS